MRRRVERRERVRRWATTAGWTVVALVGGGIGLAYAGPRGLAVAWIVLLELHLLGRAADRAARVRGARAWDWRVGRYRLGGDPAAEVQAHEAHPVPGEPVVGGPPRTPLAATGDPMDGPSRARSRGLSAHPLRRSGGG